MDSRALEISREPEVAWRVADEADAADVGKVVVESAQRLRHAGIETARLDAELLLAKVLGWDRARIHAHPEYLLSPEEHGAWTGLIERRLQREPLPYLLGEWEFFSRPFYVTPAVLIPRPETELLVEGLLDRRSDWTSGTGRPLLVDVGTGSGCIGVSLALAAPHAILILTDASPEALEVAARNAARHGASDRVETQLAVFPDGLDDCKRRIDALVSNPPYVAAHEVSLLPPEVRDHEPRMALLAGEDGLALLLPLLEKGRDLLRPGGWIALEFGIGHADGLIGAARRLGYASVSVEPDLAGFPRALFARNPPP